MLKKAVIILNILLGCMMAAHVGIGMYVQAQHPEYSAPVWSAFSYALFYILPFAVVSIGYLLLKKKQ